MPEKILLDKFKNKNSQENDKNLKITLESNNELVLDKDIEYTISNIDIYNNERNASTSYRIYGELEFYCGNILLNKTGDLSYDFIKNLERIQNQKLLENINGWYHYYNNYIKTYLEPVPDRFNFDKFDFSVLYPSDFDLIDFKFNNISINKGLAIYAYGQTNINNKLCTYFVANLNHLLNVGDEIEMTINGGQIRCFVHDIGLNGANFQNVFVINKIFDIINPTNIYFSKILNNVKVEYKSIWLKKITQTTDFDIFIKKTGYTVYQDSTVSFVSLKDIDISLIKNDVFSQLNILYFGLFKTNDNNFWSPTISGLENFISSSEYDADSFFYGGSISPIENNIEISNEHFFGGVIELSSVGFNMVSKPYYVFNSTERLGSKINEGYIYQPFYTIDLNKANNFFKNNYFYNYIQQNIYVRRQDPCNIFGLGQNALIKGSCKNYANIMVNNFPIKC